MKELVQEVEGCISSYLKRKGEEREAARKKYLAAAAEKNEGIEPTLGSSGRLHAPVNGYAWKWSIGRYPHVQWFERTFMAGEFLPWSRAEESLFGFFNIFPESGKRVAVVTLSQAKEFCKAFSLSGGINVTHGQIWENKAGEKVTYLYVKTRCKEAFEMIENYILAPHREEMARKEAEKAAIYAAAEECPEGRVQLTGTVLAEKLKETAFGEVWKMMVEEERGFKLWGSVPRSLLGETELKGQKITFTATVEQSHEEPKFGFFKRPTKASIVEAA